MRLKIIFMGGIIGILVLFLQSKAFVQEKSVSAAAVNACIANFNIEEVDLSLSVIRGYLPYLTEYSVCRAAQEDDEEICDDFLYSSRQACKTCKEYFKDYHGFIGRLFAAGQVTPEVVSGCRGKRHKFSEQVCKDVAEGILNHDVSKCKNVPEKNKADCSQLINARGSQSKPKYINALRTGVFHNCDKISNNKVQWLCKGALNKDKKLCEQSKGFEIFRRKYCEIMAQ